MKYIIVFLFLAISNVVWSQNLKLATDDQKKEIISQMTHASAIANTLECRFIQKKTISVLSETVTSEGLMYYKKEDKLRWQYNKPYSYLFILNRGKVLIKNENRTDKFDTNSNKLFKEISEIMLGSVRGNLLIGNKKFSSQYFVGTSVNVIKLTPHNKDLKQLMQAINLTISKTDWLVKSIEMQEKGGDNTVITFTEKNVNKTISDDLFYIN